MEVRTHTLSPLTLPPLMSTVGGSHYRSPPEMGDVVLDPGPHDVLLGRGGGTNNYCGNIKFRKLVNEHKMRYLTCSKVEKPNVAREVVSLWRKLNPPGRFLTKRDKEDKKEKDRIPIEPYESTQPAVWIEVGDKKAREKASQCLRERTPDVLPLLRHMKEQQESSNAKALTLASSENSQTPVTPDSVQNLKEISETAGKPNMPAMPVASSRPSKAARAKRAARAQAQKERTQARKQARSMPSPSPQDRLLNNVGDRHSPSVNGHSCSALPPDTPLINMDVNMTPPSMHTATGMSMPAGMLMSTDMERTTPRRNSIPPDCGPHPSATYADRRGSLPTCTMHLGADGDSFSGMGGHNNEHAILYTANASATIRGRDRGTGSNFDSAVGAGYSVMPGQAQVSTMEAGAFHNASSYLDMFDSTSPLNSTRFRQQQLRLQQLKLEQQHLQEQLEHQVQIEMEMRIARRAAAATGRRLGTAGSYVKQHSGLELIYPHEELPPHHRAHSLSQPLPAHQHHQQQNHQSHTITRGVEAPGYLPPSRADVDDPLLLQPSSERAPQGEQMQSRERSDPPSNSYETHCLKPSHGAFHQVTRDGSGTSDMQDLQVSRDIPRVVSREVPQETPREISPYVLREVTPTGQREGASGQAVDPRDTAADPHSEMTLAEYRRTLDAYVANNNIAITEQIYSDDENEDDNGPSATDDLSVRSFVEWKDHYRPTGAEESRNESPRPDPPARDVHPATLNQRVPVPHIPRRVQRQRSGQSLVSLKTIRSSSYTSLGGISMPSGADCSHQHHHPDDAIMEETATAKNFSSNESVVSEITVISHTIDGLDLEDHE